MSGRAGGPALRPATLQDLPEMAEVWYLCEVEDAGPPVRGKPPADLFAHDVRTGEAHVAEVGGEVVAFSSSVVRAGVRFLTNLFVRPDLQGRGLGAALLSRAMPDDGRIRATLSSRDPRAQALYIRSGMAARWPHFVLSMEGEGVPRFVEGHADLLVEVVDVQEGELPEWIERDARACGRRRPQDLDFWLASRRAAAVWFGTDPRLGYGLIQRSTPESLAFPEGTQVGPIGVEDASDLAECALAGVRLAASSGPSAVFVGVPGPSPALAPLLEAGFRIEFEELFMATDEFLDPTRYLGSGSDLF